MDTLKNLLIICQSIIQLLLYFFIESFIAAIFVNLGWKFMLQPKFEFYISFLDWVIIIWIIKIIFFDVFKLMTFTNTIKNQQNKDNDNNSNEQ